MPKKIKKDIIPEKRLLMWKVLDLIVPFIPIIILGIIQWDVYFGTRAKNAFDNIVGFAGIIIFIFIILLKLNNQNKAEGRRSKYLSVGMFVLCLLFYFLREILYQLTFISLVAALGLFLHDVWINPKIKKWERIKDKSETADINARAMAKVVAMQIKNSNRERLDGSV
ncbi:MAG: hypothetical protein GX638_03155 [Crenarchaeota archaeon]|nr:hypothetical protein [Thermoproteota archaeon]